MQSIHVKIDNRSAQLISDYNYDYNYDQLVPYWSYSVSSYVYMSKPWYRKCKKCHRPKAWHDKDQGVFDHDYIPVWDGKIKLLQRDRVPSGLFWATYKEIEKKEHIKFNIKWIAEGVEESHKSIASEGKYKFQNECTDKVVDKIRRGSGGLILNATGSGKTRIFAMIASRLDCDLLFIVDQLNLLDQARKDISKHLGEKIGKVGESKFKLKRVTVATIQTLHKHRQDRKFLDWFKHVEVICIDEIHTMLNRSNFDVIKIAKPLSVIGLTATLGLTKKDVQLKAYSLTGPVLYEYPILKGMKDQVLSKGICISLQFPNHINNIEGYTAAEAYDSKIVRNSERNWLVANIIRQAHKRGKYTICLVERLKHLEKLSFRLDEYGIAHRIVSGTFKGKSVKVSSRTASVKKFEKGKIRVILANKVMKKGVDVKRVDCVINSTGRKSKNDSIQIFGRGVRPHEDKKGLVHIDISDTDIDSKNWFSKASKSRIRALKKIGITIKKFKYIDEDSIPELFNKADKWLKQEVQELEK